MIVEDDGLIALDIQKRLESWGYEALAVVDSSEEAVKKALLLRPDLILMDIVLRGEKDGIEAVENIKKHVDVPVIYTTAYADANTMERARDTQPEAYIIKPYDFKKMKGFINMALEKGAVMKRLKKTNNQCWVMFEKSANGILLLEVITGLEGHVIDFAIEDANPAFQAMIRLNRESLQGERYSQIFPIEEKDILLEAMAEAALLRKSEQLEYYSEALKRYYDVMVLSTGKKELTVHFTDITRMKKCEELRQESQLNFRRLMESAGWVFYRISIPDGQLEYLSPTVEELSGHTVEELLQLPFLLQAIAHPDWQEDLEEKMKQALEGKGEKTYKYPIVTKDGKTRWIEQNHLVVKDDEGNPVALEAVIRAPQK
ncbi:MAG: response regulator [Methanobacteriaceae archaeon]